MPPRYSYWTILADGLPTAFRAAMKDELMPTYRRLLERHPDATLKWFARGKLWDSPEDAAADRPGAAGRGRDWRPGGQHRDPRQAFKDEQKQRNQAKRQERFRHKEARAQRARPPAGSDASPADDPRPDTRPEARSDAGPPRGRAPRPAREHRSDHDRPDRAPARKPFGKPAWDGERPARRFPTSGAPRADRPSGDRKPWQGGTGREGKPWSGGPPSRASRPWRDGPDSRGEAPRSGARPPDDSRPGSAPGARDRGPRSWDTREQSRPRAGGPGTGRPAWSDASARGGRDRGDAAPRERKPWSDRQGPQGDRPHGARKPWNDRERPQGDRSQGARPARGHDARGGDRPRPAGAPRGDHRDGPPPARRPWSADRPPQPEGRPKAWGARPPGARDRDRPPAGQDDRPRARQPWTARPDAAKPWRRDETRPGGRPGPRPARDQQGPDRPAWQNRDSGGTSRAPRDTRPPRGAREPWKGEHEVRPRGDRPARDQDGPRNAGDRRPPTGTTGGRDGARPVTRRSFDRGGPPGGGSSRPAGGQRPHKPHKPRTR